MPGIERLDFEVYNESKDFWNNPYLHSVVNLWYNRASKEDHRGTSRCHNPAIINREERRRGITT